MEAHAISLEARVQSLEQLIRQALSVVTSAASELQQIRHDVYREHTASASAVPHGQNHADPYQQLQAGFQARTLAGPWSTAPSSAHNPSNSALGGVPTQCLAAPRYPTASVATPAPNSTDEGLHKQQQASVEPPGSGFSAQEQSQANDGTRAPATGMQPSPKATAAEQDSIAQTVHADGIDQQLHDESGEPVTADAHPAADEPLSAHELQQQAHNSQLQDPTATQRQVGAHQQQEHQHGEAVQHGQQATELQDHVRNEQQDQQEPPLSSSPATSAEILSDDVDSRASEGSATVSGASSRQQAGTAGHADSEAGAAANADLAVDVAQGRETHTTMYRVPLPGSPRGFRTAGVFTNDFSCLTDTVDGSLLPNNDVPPQLQEIRSFVSHQHNLLAYYLSELSKARRHLGWNHREYTDEEEPAAEQLEDEDVIMGGGSQDEEQQQQQQAGQSSEQQQADAGDAVAAGEGTPARRQRKQAKPKRKAKPKAQPATSDQYLDILSESESEQLDGQARHSAFTALLQSLASVHNAAAAGIAAGQAAAAGAQDTAPAAVKQFHGAEMQQAFEEMQQLVQEDVQRLAQEWEQQELPRLQRVAADIWKEVHREVPHWQQTVADRQAQLEKGAKELAMSHTDNIAGYKAARKRLSEALHEWVFLYEGAKYVLSIAQLLEAPTAVETPSPDPATDGAMAVANGSWGRVRQAAAAVQAADSAGGPDASDSSGASSSSSSSDGSDSESLGSFIDESELPAGGADAAVAATPQQQVSDDSAAQSESQRQAAGDKEAAWNIAHIQTGRTEVLLGGKRQKWLLRQAALQQQQNDKQQLEQPVSVEEKQQCERGASAEQQALPVSTEQPDHEQHSLKPASQQQQQNGCEQQSQEVNSQGQHGQQMGSDVLPVEGEVQSLGQEASGENAVHLKDADTYEKPPPQEAAAVSKYSKANGGNASEFLGSAGPETPTAAQVGQQQQGTPQAAVGESELAGQQQQQQQGAMQAAAGESELAAEQQQQQQGTMQAAAGESELAAEQPLRAAAEAAGPDSAGMAAAAAAAAAAEFQQRDQPMQGKAGDQQELVDEHRPRAASKSPEPALSGAAEAVEQQQDQLMRDAGQQLDTEIVEGLTPVQSSKHTASRSPEPAVPAAVEAGGKQQDQLVQDAGLEESSDDEQMQHVRRVHRTASRSPAPLPAVQSQDAGSHEDSDQDLQVVQRVRPRTSRSPAPVVAAAEQHKQQQQDEPMHDAELQDRSDDEQMVVVPRTRRTSSPDSGGSTPAAGAEAAAPAADHAVQADQLVGLVSFDDIMIQEEVSEADEADEALPPADYKYPCTVIKGEPQPGVLKIGESCELLQTVSGGEQVTWYNLWLQPFKTVQPRWHVWQEASSLLEGDQRSGVGRVQQHQGPVIQEVLHNVRPQPPQELCSLIPLDQLQDGQDAAAWASSTAGLLHLSRTLRPRVLLEYQKQNGISWVPGVVLHSRMTRPALSSSVKGMLQQHSKAAAESTTAAAAGGAAADSSAAAAGTAAGKGCWDGRVNTAGLVEMGRQLRDSDDGTTDTAPAANRSTDVFEPPAEDDVVLVLLLLGAKFATVRHIQWGVLLEDPARLRYMTHWKPETSTATSSSSSSSDDGSSEDGNDFDSDSSDSGSAPIPGHTGRAKARKAAAGGSAAPAKPQPGLNEPHDETIIICGTWRRLVKLLTLPVNCLAKSQLQLEHKAWLKLIGWPIPSRRRRLTQGQQQLSDRQVQQIAQKLARRPTAVAVTPALVKAAGLAPGGATRKSGKVNKWHKISGRTARKGDAGPGRVAGISPLKYSVKQEPGNKRGRARKQQVLDDSDTDVPRPQAKRRRTRYSLRGQTLDSDLEEPDLSELEESLLEAAAQKPPRRRLSSAEQAKAAAAAASSTSEGDEDDFETATSSEDDVSSGSLGVEVDEKVVVDKSLSLLYDDEPVGPLNPRLPRCWFAKGQEASKQVLKPHQLNGLRFMYDCLVKEHSSAAMERRQQERNRKGKGKQTGRKRTRQEPAAVAAAAADDADDSDFVSLDGSSGSEKGSESEGAAGSEQSEADDAGGCILAHSMGLGKSFQTVALLWVYFQKMRGRALLVVPTNVVPNWVDEFLKWLPGKNDPDYRASRLISHKVFMALKGGRDLAREVDRWMRLDGSVIVMSYDIFIRAVKDDIIAENTPAAAAAAALQNRRVAQLAKQGSGFDSPAVSGDVKGADAVDADAAALDDDDADDLADEPTVRPKTPAGMRERVRKALLEGASVVVADEAHQMKNSKSQKCRMMRQVSTMRRLALTGYPLQNKLEEYYQMILWVQPEELFMSHREFKKKFIDPITEGQKPGAEPGVRRTMAQKLSILHDLTASFIQRAGPEILLKDLPPKHEYVLALAPTATQANLLRQFLDLVGDRRSLFRDYRTMRRILDTKDHGYADLKRAVEDARSGHAAQLQLADVAAGAAVDDKDIEQQLVVQPAAQGSARRNVLPLELVEQLLQQYPQEQQQQQKQQRQGLADAADEGLPADPNSNPSSTGEQDLLPKEVFIKQLLQSACVDKAEKVVIFSESLTVLDALEVLLQQGFGYKLERQYVRLEGKTGAEERRRLIRKFNNKQHVKVFLISTLAGSVGINLVAARRMVLYDMPWNPVHNKQAASRIWRYGQTRPCFLYHLMYSGTVEQHMYEQTLAKLELFEQVIERQSKRAAFDFVSEQLQTKAYMLQTVTPLDDTELTERMNTVLAVPPAAASAPTAATAAASAAESDSVLKQILQDGESAKALAVVDLKNHEEQLKDDPTSKLDKEEKRKAALAFERERRMSTRYTSISLASQAGPTQGPLGAAGISERTQRLERRRQLRLEQLYGKYFTEEVEQPPEPAPAHLGPNASLAEAAAAGGLGAAAAAAAATGAAVDKGVHSGVAAAAALGTAVARTLGLDGLVTGGSRQQDSSGTAWQVEQHCMGQAQQLQQQQVQSVHGMRGSLQQHHVSPVTAASPPVAMTQSPKQQLLQRQPQQHAGMLRQPQQAGMLTMQQQQQGSPQSPGMVAAARQQAGPGAARHYLQPGVGFVVPAGSRLQQQQSARQPQQQSPLVQVPIADRQQPGAAALLPQQFTGSPIFAAQRPLPQQASPVQQQQQQQQPAGPGGSSIAADARLPLKQQQPQQPVFSAAPGMATPLVARQPNAGSPAPQQQLRGFSALTASSAAAARDMINREGGGSVIKLVGRLLNQLPLSSQRALVHEWLQSVVDGRMTEVQLWCQFRELQKHTGQLQQEHVQIPVQPQQAQAGLPALMPPQQAQQSSWLQGLATQASTEQRTSGVRLGGSPVQQRAASQAVPVPGHAQLPLSMANMLAAAGLGRSPPVRQQGATNNVQPARLSSQPAPARQRDANDEQQQGKRFKTERSSLGEGRALSAGNGGDVIDLTQDN